MVRGIGVADITRVWGTGPFFLQRRPLSHPEAVLFIRDDQAQIIEYDIGLQQSVSADQ